MRAHNVGKGYRILALSVDGDEARAYVHRLVAVTFIPNPENKPYVNHKDGCKQNNRADNLEWCTMEENNIHAMATGLNYTGPKRGPYNTGARSPICKAKRAKKR